MSALFLNSMCISLEVGDADYGKGNKVYMNMTAKVPEGDTSIKLPDDLESVFNTGLDMYAHIWETLMASRCASSVVKGDAWQEDLATFRKRIGLIKAKAS